MLTKDRIHVAGEVNDLWTELKKNKDLKSIKQFQTGYQVFDEATLNMNPGDLTVIYSSDSNDKTHFVLNVLQRVAKKRDFIVEGNSRNTPIEGVPSIFFSLKESPSEILKQLMCIEGGFPRKGLDQMIGNGQSKELEIAKKALGKSTLNILYPGLNIQSDHLLSSISPDFKLFVIDSFELLKIKESSKDFLTALCEIKESIRIFSAHCIVCVDLVEDGEKTPTQALAANAWVEAGSDNVFCLHRGEGELQSGSDLSNDENGTKIYVNVIKSRANQRFPKMSLQYFSASGVMKTQKEQKI